MGEQSWDFPDIGVILNENKPVSNEIRTSQIVKRINVQIGKGWGFVEDFGGEVEEKNRQGEVYKEVWGERK